MGVIIALVALFAAMVIPSMAHWRAGNEYRAFPGRLLRFVARAKQDAIDNKSSRSIGYDATTGELRMFWTDPQSQEEQEGGRLALPAEMELGRVMLRGTDASVQNWRMTFYQDGTAEDAGIECRDQDQYVTITTDSLGNIKQTRQQLPEQSDVRWAAGENEVRSQ